MLAVFVAGAAEAKELKHFRTFYNSDLVVAGLGGMRNHGYGTLTLSGLSGPVTKAYLYWHGPTKSTNPNANANVFVNGQAVQGTNIGFSDDNCWNIPGQGSFDNSQAYRADVTDIVTQDGQYLLTGFRDDPPSVPQAVNTNGVSLIVIYDNGVAGDNHDIVIYEGNDSSETNGYDGGGGACPPWYNPPAVCGWTATVSGIDYVTGSVFLQFHVSDGQLYQDWPVAVNGTVMTSDYDPFCWPKEPPPYPHFFDGDTVPSAGGISHPNCIPCSACSGFLWDIKGWDVTSLLNPGPNSLLVTMDPNLWVPMYVPGCVSLVALIADLPPGAALPPEPTPEPSMRGGGGGGNGCEEDTAEPPPANSSSPPPAPSSAGNPVSILTGNMYLDQTDVIIPGVGRGLRFTRSYNSVNATAGIAGRFGAGWTDSYDKTILVEPGQVGIILRKANGVPNYFQNDGSGTTYVGSIPYSKESWIVRDDVNGTFTRHFRVGGSEFYDTLGLLMSIEDAWGNVTTLTRDPGTGKLTGVTDPAGRELTFTYTGSFVTAISGPGGPIASYGYDPANRLETVTYAGTTGGYRFTYDPAGQLLTVSDLNVPAKILETHTYENGRAITSETSDGRDRYTFEYAPQTKATDALGNVTSYDWDVFGGMKRVTKITGSCLCGNGSEVQEWGYDDYGRVKSYTDGNGETSSYLYDPDTGDLVTRTDPETDLGTLITEYVHDPTTGTLTSVTMPSVVAFGQNKVTSFTYDHGQVRTRTETGRLGDGSAYSYVTTMGYNTRGQLESIDGPRTDVSDTTTFLYDTLPPWNLGSLTRAGSLTTQYLNYTPHGRPQTVRDPNLVDTTYLYDERDRVKDVTIGVDTTHYTYTPSGKLYTIQLPLTNMITYSYDTYDRLEYIKDGLNNTMNYTYDLMGRREKEEIKNSSGDLQKKLSFEYDAFSRLWKVINPDTLQTYTQYGYDGAGNRKIIRNPREYTTTYNYDAVNRVREVIQPGPLGPVTTVYTYDLHNNLASAKDPEEHLTTYTHDDMGRVYREVSPDTGTTTYTYDPAGNRVSKTDARGIVSSYAYDALSRVTSVAYSTDRPILYTYDVPCQMGKGRLCKIRDDIDTATFSYDIKGQLLQESKVLGGATYVTSYTYDANRNLRTITYPGTARLVTYTYDSADRVESVTTTPSGGSQQPLATLIQSKPWGDVSALTYGNGLLGTTVYDNQYRVSQITTSNGIQIQALDFTHDANGNVLTATRPLDPSRNRTYTYDSLDRLGTAAGSWGQLSWSYDDSGNRLTQIGPSGTTTYAYFTGTNRLQSFLEGSQDHAFSYDANGNTIAETGRTYLFGSNNRLSQVKTTQPVLLLGAYAYYANGQRARKIAGGSTTIYHYDLAGRVIAETIGGAGGATLAEYVYLNGQPIYEAVAGNYIHRDHLGSPEAMTNGSQAKVWDIEAWPFGDHQTITGSASLKLRFPGQYFDSESGFHQNWFRDYYPGTGRYVEEDPLSSLADRRRPKAGHYEPRLERFVSEDSIGFGGGPNYYSYVRNNPINAIDPTGLVIQVCQRLAETRWMRALDGNHAYFWDPRIRNHMTPRDCGAGTSSEDKPGTTGYELPDPSNTDCFDVPGSDGLEDALMICCRATANTTLVGTCWRGLQNCLEQFNLALPADSHMFGCSGNQCEFW